MVQDVVPQDAMPRPRIDIDDDTHQRVEEYAHQNGLRMPRSFGELLEKGLEAEEGDD